METIDTIETQVAHMKSSVAAIFKVKKEEADTPRPTTMAEPVACGPDHLSHIYDDWVSRDFDKRSKHKRVYICSLSDPMTGICSLKDIRWPSGRLQGLTHIVSHMKRHICLAHDSRPVASCCGTGLPNDFIDYNYGEYPRPLDESL